jgi:superfamily I DNA/RNA helicase
MNLTSEQLDIIYSDNDFIYVSARAGTGKTTTLSEFVKIRKKDTFLYIVYNSAIKEEALQKFPERVTIHTIHSLAFEKIGFKYRNKLTKNIKTEDIFYTLPYFKNKNIEDKETFKYAFAIGAVINRFCNSAYKSFEEIPHEEELLKLAKEYWIRMIELNDSEVKITHDGYLKLFHLSNPSLNYDYILVDEAQDSNEVMLDIVYSQNSKKVFVGDQHQRIYSFRGALNVFTENTYFKEDSDYVHLTLTQSFRFGKEIASIANKLLSVYKKEEKLLEGSDRNSEIGIIDKNLQYTIITRTNSKIFDLAVRFAKEGKTIAINGGVEPLVNQILDGYYLYKGEKDKIKNETLKKFTNYRNFKAVAENIKYPEYLFLVKIIEKYGESLEKNIHLIKKHASGMRNAEIILTTAHKSKGLEFVSVLIEEDFIDLFDKNGNLISEEIIDLEEINLLYVAVTRATHDLELNNNLENLMNI